MTLIAKSNGETLYFHSILTYKYGMKIIDMLPFSAEERKELKALSSLPLLFHDIGKSAVGFQEAIRNNSNWKGLRHEILSAVFLSQFNLKEEQIFAVITHHKDIYSSHIKKMLPEEQIDQICGDTEILQYMKEEFKKNKEEIECLCTELLNYINSNMKFSIMLKEGIGINEVWLDGINNSKYGQMRNVDIKKRILASKLRGIIKAADHLASSHYEPISQINMNRFQISKYPLREFQKKCKECDKDIILIAPTGSGKTEATLLWAQNNQKKNSRLFYVLPYQASINAMHKRLGRIFGEKNIGVLHANAVSYLYNMQTLDEEDKLDYQNKVKNLAGLAREIYYPVRICTPHQLLRLGLKGQGWEYLYLEMTNSLIIYDEIHAFQPRIVGLTLATAKLAKKLGTKIAFASATFPEFLKNLIIDKLKDIEVIMPSENYKTDKVILNKKRHNVIILQGNLEDNLKLIIEEINKGKRALIITNHVKSAQEIYDRLKQYNPILLHSRFNKRDRRDKENKLLDENKPKAVIATQVIEVSLDIDYEVMFTEPAPIDALTQRFGRINRKGERKPGNIYILKEQLSIHNLYNKERVKRTIELLSTIRNPLSEKDLLDITNIVYKGGYTEEEMEQFELGFNNEEILDFERNLIAGISRQWVSEVKDTIDGNCEVIPISYLDEYENLINKGLWIEAKDLFVSVKYNLVRNKISEINDILVANCIYDSNKGLIVKEKPSNFGF